jgi:predicted small secreted protein
MLKQSIKLVVLGAAIAFALAGCAPFGCMLR